jgi:predicted nuclease of predicted toxin-antitoxin system
VILELTRAWLTLFHIVVWMNSTDLILDNPPKQREIDQVIEYRRRKAKARFYADENFPALGVELLREIGARVFTVQELRRRRHPDENHVVYALKHGYILLTCDRDYLNERRFPLIHCPTILVFDFGEGSREEILQAFACLKRILSAPQFFDKWTKIDASRDAWIEYSRTLDGQTHRSKYRVYKGSFQEWVEDEKNQSLR